MRVRSGGGCGGEGRLGRGGGASDGGGGGGGGGGEGGFAGGGDLGGRFAPGVVLLQERGFAVGAPPSVRRGVRTSCPAFPCRSGRGLRAGSARGCRRALPRSGSSGRPAACRDRRLHPQRCRGPGPLRRGSPAPASASRPLHDRTPSCTARSWPGSR